MDMAVVLNTVTNHSQCVVRGKKGKEGVGRKKRNVGMEGANEGGRGVWVQGSVSRAQ